MTHDPYQTYQTLAAFSGLTNPFSTPYTAMQTSAINPLAGYNPLALNVQPFAPIGYGGIAPQQTQFQNPLIAGLMQNPYAVAALSNALLAGQIYQQPYQQYQQPFQQAHPHIGQGGWVFGQQGPPLGQFTSPFGPTVVPPTLAPQSWVGQGQGQGQLNPLVLQSIARALQTQGINPWVSF